MRMGIQSCIPIIEITPYLRPDQRSSVSRRLRETGAVEYLHRWEQIIGGICRAGFVVEDLIEPVHAKRDAAVNSFADRATFIAPYVRIKGTAEPICDRTTIVDCLFIVKSC